MNITGLHQRATYKLVDAILTAKASDPLDMLSQLVRHIVDSSMMVMTGGRVWELDANTDEYVLRYQYGEMEHMELGTRNSVAETPELRSLATRNTYTTPPIDAGERGTLLYSLTGVGELVQRPLGQFPTYALAFTAHEQSDEFVDAMLVVSSAASTALRNMRTVQQNKKIRKDLDQAWQIQRGLVPDHHRQFHRYDIYGISLPESVVGGDYFDYLQRGDEQDRLGLVISDAASKGLSAAVQALFVSGALRMAASFDTKMTSLVSRLNTLIYDTFPNERFVSLFMCELLSSQSGLVLYVNAGHCPPMHYKASTSTISTLPPTGGILGIVPEQPFRLENLNMSPGDILVLFTDGITEAQNRAGDLFGEERLAEVIRQHAQETSEHIAQIVLDTVNRFSAGGAYSDDKTIIVVKSAVTGVGNRQ